jgi:hypothetical protein
MRFVKLVFGLFVLAGLMRAQETRGNVSGIVSDSSGAVVAGATLRLTNVETGVVLTATSNETGLYRFLFLNPGRYKLVATACRWCWKWARRPSASPFPRKRR